MRRSFEMKILGIIVLTIEAGAMLFLLCLQFLVVYMTASDARTWQDCAWVGFYSVVLPCVAQENGFFQALEEDIRHFKEVWG